MTLRARIFAGFGLVLVAFVVVGAIVVVSQRDRLVDQLDRQLEAVAPLNRGAPPRADAGQPAAPDAPPPETGQPSVGQPDAPISDLYLAAVHADGTVDVIVQGQLLDAVPDIDADVVNGTLGRRFTSVSSSDDSTQFRVLLQRSDTDNTVSVIALPLTDVDDSISQLIVTFILLAVFVAAVLALLAWWIARLGLRPISDVTAAATAIAAGDREQRVAQRAGRTEAGQLAEAFNEMLDQRDEAEDHLRRFVSDASHELRTPLTSIRGYLDLYAQGGFRDEGQLDDVIRRMQSETSRMTGLVENLLQLARLDEEQPLQRSRFDLGSLIHDVIADSLAASPDRSISADIAPELPAVSLDRYRTQQLVSGLVANALTHAPGANVTVRARLVDRNVEVVVADDGPGLSAEQAAHVFERFYRGDPSRGRAAGGSGLGLAIAQSIATAHGGSISLRTGPGEGCEFIVRLPSD